MTLSPQSFDNVMKKVLDGDKPSSIAVAVSGGADSLCLTLIAADWAKAHGIQMKALTVDHGLRSESAAEAAYVHDVLMARGICHKTLVWQGTKPKTRIEEKAREARYQLLLEACKDAGIKHLLLAHHRDDQAETFWLRLARGSGVDGLSAMQARTQRDGVYLLRPFLDFSRIEIQNYLSRKYALDWVEDPSNQAPMYERVRFRQAQKDLDVLGLDTVAVALSARRLARVRAALEEMTDDFMHRLVEKNAAGFCFVKAADFNALPEELRLRVLEAMLAYAGGSARLPQLEKMLEAAPGQVTLGGCQIVPVKTGFYVCVELAKMPGPKKIKAHQKARWGRFEVLCDQDVTIAPLMACLAIKGLPALVRRTIPAFFDKKGLAFVPALDYKRQKTDITGSIEIKD